MDLQQLFSEYKTAYRSLDFQCDDIHKKIEQKEEHIERIKQQIERLKKKEQRIAFKKPSWVETIVWPIAREMALLLPEWEADVSGPFGIGARVGITFWRKGIDKKDKYALGNSMSLTLEPIDLWGDRETLRVVDYKTNTGSFEKGTIWQINGLNHPTLPMPDTIQGLIDFMKSQYNEED